MKKLLIKMPPRMIFILNQIKTVHEKKYGAISFVNNDMKLLNTVSINSMPLY